MKDTTVGADLLEEVWHLTYGVGIPVQKLAGLVVDGAPRKKSGVSAHVKNDLKNTTDRDWITRH